MNKILKMTRTSKVLLFLVTGLISVGNAYGQPAKKDVDDITERINFIVGVGANYIPTILYQNPAINKTNNSVLIEKGQRIKTSLNFGIVYTPYFRTFYQSDGSTKTVPHGISISTFINPLTLSKATDAQPFFNALDFGVGIGYKFAADFLIMGTVEWFSVNQPKDWFVNEYQANNKPFLINNAPQQSFDLADSNIFRNKTVTTFGFKFCYAFDIVKNVNKKEK